MKQIWILYRVSTSGGGHGEGAATPTVEFSHDFFETEERAKQYADRLNQNEWNKWILKDFRVIMGTWPLTNDVAMKPDPLLPVAIDQ